MKIKTVLGISMLEIMVAIAVSLILMLGILQIFISNKTTYRLENSLAQLQDNGRYVHYYMNQVVRNTAYRSNIPDTQFQSIASIFTGGNVYISGTENTGTNGSDTFTIRYQGSGDGAGTPDNTIRDCLNRGVDALAIATNTFSINADSALICQTSNPSAAPVNDTQVILENVENMQVLYGEDVDNDKSPDRYVSAGHPTIDFNNIVSIKVSILLRSDAQNAPVIDNNTYNLLNTAYTPGGDNFLRKTYTFTITLRNVITEVNF